MTTISIDNDHAGVQFKNGIQLFLEDNGYDVINFGNYTSESVNYPDYVHPVVCELKDKNADFAILICGGGMGVSMTANKYSTIIAAVCWEPEIASLARKHNNANVLCLPARFMSEKSASVTALIFLQSEFEEGRYIIRVKKITSCSS